MPAQVRPRCAQCCTCVHGRLQIVIWKQLVKNARMPSGGRDRRLKSSHPDQRFRGSADCRLCPTAGFPSEYMLFLSTAWSRQSVQSAQPYPRVSTGRRHLPISASAQERAVRLEHEQPANVERRRSCTGTGLQTGFLLPIPTRSAPVFICSRSAGRRREYSLGAFIERRKRIVESDSIARPDSA
jgi:hypothetical protein